nr:alpha/beta hydrolases superfamily protein [Tanacetum cinerariifolium]
PNAGVSKYSSDDEDPTSNKWKPQLAWITKALELALQLWKWPLPTGHLNDKIPPDSRSLAEILASFKRVNLESKNEALLESSKNINKDKDDVDIHYQRLL